MPPVRRHFQTRCNEGLGGGPGGDFLAPGGDFLASLSRENPEFVEVGIVVFQQLNLGLVRQLEILEHAGAENIPESCGNPKPLKPFTCGQVTCLFSIPFLDQVVVTRMSCESGSKLNSVSYLQKEFPETVLWRLSLEVF